MKKDKTLDALQNKAALLRRRLGSQVSADVPHKEKVTSKAVQKERLRSEIKSLEKKIAPTRTTRVSAPEDAQSAPAGREQERWRGRTLKRARRDDEEELAAMKSPAHLKIAIENGASNRLRAAPTHTRAPIAARNAPSPYKPYKFYGEVALRKALRVAPDLKGADEQLCVVTLAGATRLRVVFARFKPRTDKKPEELMRAAHLIYELDGKLIEVVTSTEGWATFVFGDYPHDFHSTPDIAPDEGCAVHKLVIYTPTQLSTRLKDWGKAELDERKAILEHMAPQLKALAAVPAWPTSRGAALDVAAVLQEHERGWCAVPDEKFEFDEHVNSYYLPCGWAEQLQGGDKTDEMYTPAELPSGKRVRLTYLRKTTWDNKQGELVDSTKALATTAGALLGWAANKIVNQCPDVLMAGHMACAVREWDGKFCWPPIHTMHAVNGGKRTFTRGMYGAQVGLRRAGCATVVGGKKAHAGHAPIARHKDRADKKQSVDKVEPAPNAFIGYFPMRV